MIYRSYRRWSSDLLSAVGGSEISLPSQVHNDEGSKRVVVTKELPGERWLELLTQADCRVEISKSPEVITSKQTIKKLIGSQCDGVLGQLTEVRFGSRSSHVLFFGLTFPGR